MGERRKSTNTSRRRLSRSATPSSPRCTLLLVVLLPAACPVASPVALLLVLPVVPPAPPSRRSIKLFSSASKNISVHSKDQYHSTFLLFPSKGIVYFHQMNYHSFLFHQRQ